RAAGFAVQRQTHATYVDCLAGKRLFELLLGDAVREIADEKSGTHRASWSFVLPGVRFLRGGPPSPQAGRFTLSRSSLPALNVGTLRAAISIGAPVCGLRPVRAADSRTANAPNPRRSIRSPRE